jgi:hypothetical protein
MKEVVKGFPKFLWVIRIVGDEGTEIGATRGGYEIIDYFRLRFELGEVGG